MADVLMPQQRGSGIEKLKTAYEIYSMFKKGSKAPDDSLEDDDESEKWSDNSNPMVRRMTSSMRTA